MCIIFLNVWSLSITCSKCILITVICNVLCLSIMHSTCILFQRVDPASGKRPEFAFLGLAPVGTLRHTLTRNRGEGTRPGGGSFGTISRNAYFHALGCGRSENARRKNCTMSRRTRTSCRISPAKSDTPVLRPSWPPA